MMKLAGCLIFGVFYLLVPLVFAQDSDQSSSDSGVLVSSPISAQISDHDHSGNKGGGDAPPDQINPNSWGNRSYRHAAGNDSSQNTATDEIIVKSTNAVMSQITANMKLTQDQISAIEPVITDNIVKVRNLQLSLEKGTIDSKAMYNQRQLLTEAENQGLGLILTSDQMRVWMNIQNQ